MKTVTEAELFRVATEARLSAVHTALPGIVVSYDPATQTADVRPAVKRLVPTAEEGEYAAETLPVVPSVPVLWPRAGLSWFAPELHPGDGVLLVFCESDPTIYLRSGEVSEPADVRRHSMAHAVAIPGFGPSSAALPAPAALGQGAALSGMLDKLIAVLKTAAGDPAVVAALNTAFPSIVGSTTPTSATTTASHVLKLEE